VYVLLIKAALLKRSKEILFGTAKREEYEKNMSKTKERIKNPY